MTQAKITDRSLGMDVYDCKCPWPEGSELRIHQSGPDNKANLAHEILLEEAMEQGMPLPEPPKPRYSFVSFVPAPANIPARDRFYEGLGYQRKKITIPGGGLTFEEAEEKAWKKYQEIAACNHNWYRHTMSDEKRTKLLDGDASCTVCRVHVHNLMMDDMLWRAMNLASEAHNGQKRKYGGGPYISHPHNIYMRVAWWKELPEPQWTNMACAAWLHDVLEDCPHITEQQILEATNKEVLAIVRELTNPSKGSSLPRFKRKAMDRAHISQASWEARVIKMFDRIDNLRDLEKCPDKNFVNLYAEESWALHCVLASTDQRLSEELRSWIEAAKKWAKQ